MQNRAWQEGLPSAAEFIVKDNYILQELLDLMAFLRSDHGCPWDRVQTHATLRKNLLEEAYEAIDAIDSGRPERLCDELGDVLMQVVFHAQLAMEAGEFTFDDVITAICRKLISRHTHIFGEDQADNPESVLENWEKNKRVEKGFASLSQVLQDVPKSLPALHRSFKVQQKAAQVGFDWPDASGPRGKIMEELDEIESCISSCDQAVLDGRLSPADASRALEDEVGDLLFSTVNYARHLKVQPEIALTSTTDKFIRRFSRLEEIAGQNGQQVETMGYEAQDQLWEQVKREEREAFMT